MHLHPPYSFRPAAPLAVSTHTMKKRNKKSFNGVWPSESTTQTTGEFIGRTAQELGFWPCSSLQSLWVPSLHSFHSRDVGHASDSEGKKVPKYRDQIPSPGLVVFPKPVPALVFSFNLSDSVSHQAYIDDLSHCWLKRTEESHRCANRNFLSRRVRIPDMSVSSFLTWSILWYGWSHIWLPIRNPCILVKISKIIVLKPQGDQDRLYCKMWKHSSSINLSSNGKIDLKYFHTMENKKTKLHGSYVQSLVAVQLSFGSDGDVKK